MPRYSPRTGALQEYQVGPFDSSHLYVQWGGKLPGGEQWSCGFRMWKSGGSSESDAVAVLPNVAGALAEFHTRGTSFIATAAKFSFVKVNAIGTNGKYIGNGTNEATFGDTPGAGGQTGTFPNQVALAVSLTTGFSRGPAHRGRFFMPLPSLPVATDGRVDKIWTDQVEASAETMRGNVNSAGAGHVMVVMSRKMGAPGHRAVTGIEVGRVLDTQRRRRRSLAESYNA